MSEDHELAAANPAARPVALVLVHALAWAPFLLYMLTVVPRLKVFFAETGVHVSHLTMLVLEYSDFLVALEPWWLIGLLIFLVVDWAILYNLALARRSVLFWTWFFLLALAPIIFWLLSWFAVSLAANDVLHNLAA